MIVHLYAHCWNEELMLPHFFSHYDRIADRYFIFDTGSTDRSRELLESHPRVELTRIDDEVDSFVTANLARHNNHWKQSRGKADWVIVTDIDEHVYHADLRRYLARCQSERVTIIKTEGYEMVSDEFPRTTEPLHQTVNRGMRWDVMDKYQLFDPNRIEEINWLPGRHEANPTGEVVFPVQREVKLLHYKYLGLEYTMKRYQQLRTGLRPGDIAGEWGYQYLWDEARITAQFEHIRNSAIPVIETGA
jgi:glycosyl transferase family 2